MRTLTAGVLAVLALGGPGVVISSEIAAETDQAPAAGIAAFVPGPPLWLPPEQHPKPMVKSSSLEDVVDQCVAEAMLDFDTPGASAAVIVDGELVYEQGYGVKRRGGSAAVNAETQFRIGSVTKMLTAAAVMQQVEAGTVFLDDRLHTLVPEADFRGHRPAEEITIHRLLTHATGIPDLSFNASGLTGPNVLSDWAAELSEVGLHAPPGVFWNYSNPNFSLAGLVVERASGEGYRSYMDDHVFGPAGMSSTTFDPAAVVARGNASFGHFDDGSGQEIVYAPDAYDNDAYAPAGYAFSTAGDIARWALLLADGGGEVLSPESAKTMQRPHQSMDTLPGFGYGYGIFVEPFFDLEIRQHGGNIWGWGAFVLWHPERRFVVTVLANTYQSLSGAAYCIADYVLEPDHSVTPELPPADPELLRSFEGFYDATVGNSWSFIPYPVMGEVFAAGDGRLSVHFWDPAGSWAALWDLDHVAGGLFYVDVNYDGTYDLDLSFLTTPTPPVHPRWLRMRPIVGYPQTTPREGQRPAP